MQLWITGRLHSLEAPWLQRATPASVYDKLYLLYHIRSTLSTDLHRPALCSQCKNRRVGRGVAFKCGCGSKFCAPEKSLDHESAKVTEGAKREGLPEAQA